MFNDEIASILWCFVVLVCVFFNPGELYTLSVAYKNDYICVSENTDYGFYVAREAHVICYMNGIRIRTAAHFTKKCSQMCILNPSLPFKNKCF